MRTRTLVVASAALLLLTGCAAPTAAGRAPSASPTPTAACPEQPGVELPPECAGYDPEHSMAQNDAYRQRGELDPAVEEAARDIAEAAADDLEALRTSGEPVTADAVVDLLEAEGLSSVQTREGAGHVLFGAVAATGGCVFGAVAPEAVTIDVGGGIADGGCLPAQ
ncbi:hypothetical protein M1D46_16580 [Microbacterium sp. JZ70]